MSGAASVGLAMAGLLIAAVAASQWRRRASITERADRWFPASDQRWRSVNRVRVRAGALVLAVLGLLLVFTGIVNALRAVL